MKVLRKKHKNSVFAKVRLYESEAGSGCTNYSACTGAGRNCTNKNTCR